MDRLSLGSPLLPTVPFVLEYEFDGAVTGTPTVDFYVDGSLNGSSVEALVSGNLWKFTITPSSIATVGASARIRLTADVGGAIFVDLYSWIAATANLIETDGVYKYSQNSIDETAKTADVTVTKV